MVSDRYIARLHAQPLCIFRVDIPCMSMHSDVAIVLSVTILHYLVCFTPDCHFQSEVNSKLCGMHFGTTTHLLNHKTPVT